MFNCSIFLQKMIRSTVRCEKISIESPSFCLSWVWFLTSISKKKPQTRNKWPRNASGCHFSLHFFPSTHHFEISSVADLSLSPSSLSDVSPAPLFTILPRRFFLLILLTDSSSAYLRAAHCYWIRHSFRGSIAWCLPDVCSRHFFFVYHRSHHFLPHAHDTAIYDGECCLLLPATNCFWIRHQSFRGSFA